MPKETITHKLDRVLLKQEIMQEDITEIKEHARLTNGRVTENEKKLMLIEAKDNAEAKFALPHETVVEKKWYDNPKLVGAVATLLGTVSIALGVLYGGQ